MSDTLDPAVITTLHSGGVIAYPTEAVFGLGCDPDNPLAVNRLLAIKQRPVSKGLILIAADINQLHPYIDLPRIPSERLTAIEQSWPGPHTWVMPAKCETPQWLTGDFDSIAVRVSAHPVVRQLCQAFGKPLVSTSANLTGQPAITDFEQLQTDMADQVDHLVPGPIDVNRKPSTITDALTGVVYRQ